MPDPYATDGDLMRARLALHRERITTLATDVSGYAAMAIRLLEEGNHSAAESACSLAENAAQETLEAIGALREVMR